MINPLDLSGKNIMVTGASTGIGKGIALLLSRLGANIIMVARNEERLLETYDALEPGNHSYCMLDLNQLEEIGGMMNHICSNGRKLNGLVHAAGVSFTIPLQYLKIKDLTNMMYELAFY